MAEWQTVIGLEVHVQLKTKTKLFCSCSVESGGEPNRNVCPGCLGMPGTLPVPNEKAVELAVRLGLALHCEIDPQPLWTRKNYFYPDLSSGYQITQTGATQWYDHPICRNGWLEIDLEDGEKKRIRINRIHIEEDAGKLVHDLSHSSSHFDANRGGTPLCEIVSEPDLRSEQEAVAYLSKLKQIVEYLEVGDADMEKGNLRCDANVSIRPGETAPFGTRVEIKNLNSFTNLEKAVAAERELQIVTLEMNGEVQQCTKRYDVARNQTFVMRTKEDALDYRYTPDPNLPRLQIDPALVERVRGELPELPEARRQRYIDELGLTPYDAQVLCAERPVAEWFEKAAEKLSNKKLVANWMMTEVLREAKSAQGAEVTIPASQGLPLLKFGPGELAELVNLIEEGTISGKIAKTVFAEMVEKGGAPRKIVEEKGLLQVSDFGEIEKVVQSVLDANPAQLEQYKGGNQKLRGYFVGQVMKAMAGKGNPAVINQVLDKLVGGA